MSRADPHSAAAALFAACLREACTALLEREAELCALDRAIGDGDHGTNMARAARALIDEADALAALPLGPGLEKAGMIVAMRVGGASGPLYGTLLIGMGRAWQEPVSLATIAEAFAQGVAAAAARGRSKQGEKTMLDVLVPAAEAAKASAGQGTEAFLDALLAAGTDGLEATRPLRATRGRASFVGERSIGHLDPGAASAEACLRAIARAVRNPVHAAAGATA